MMHECEPNVCNWRMSVWLHEMGWNNEIHPYQSFVLIFNNLIPSSLDKYQNVLYKHFKQLAWKVSSHFFKWSTHWFMGLHPITKKMPYFEQGQEKLLVVYVQNENWFLDPNFQITCVKKNVYYQLYVKLSKIM